MKNRLYILRVMELAATNEVQTISCNANGGSIKLAFNGKQTNSIPYDATATAIQTAIQSLSTVTTVAVTIVNGQTSLRVLPHRNLYPSLYECSRLQG